jgi:hypothetical protein
MQKKLSKYGARAIDKVREKTPAPRDDVPGFSPSPASNLVMADIAVRAGTYIMRRSVEKGMLRGRYGNETARQIVRNRPLAHSLASFALAKVATRSIPGAVIVGGGMLAKTLFDRSRSRRARREGDRAMIEQARDED